MLVLWEISKTQSGWQIMGENLSYLVLQIDLQSSGHTLGILWSYTNGKLFLEINLEPSLTLQRRLVATKSSISCSTLTQPHMTPSKTTQNLTMSKQLEHMIKYLLQNLFLITTTATFSLMHSRTRCLDPRML